MGTTGENKYIDRGAVRTVGGEEGRYRSLAARANFLAQDRSDIRFAVNDVARGMQDPKLVHWEKLKHLGRYLRGHIRYVNKLGYPGAVRRLDAITDSDHAGCPVTRKSTSGRGDKAGAVEQRARSGGVIIGGS